MALNETNWAGNLRYGARRIHFPETVGEVSEIVGEARQVRALGTRHSFNDIADCDGDLISTSRLNRVIGIDREKMTVKVEGGVRYGELGEYLHGAGFALGNMASLPHISVAGACATATHGSGVKSGNLATAVVAMEIVKGDGEVVEVSRDISGPTFDGMVVGLGALGVVTTLTLKIEPTYWVRQDVYEWLPWKELESNYERIAGGAYSVSLFTDWDRGGVNQVWVKRRMDGEGGGVGDHYFGARLAGENRHPVADVSAEHCTTQRGEAGPWHERLPHFRMGFTPSRGEELQSEYFVPRREAVGAFCAMRPLRERIAPMLVICELRTVAADALWMSPCYQQDCAAIHFTWKQDWEGVRAALGLIEKELEAFGPRPHWGKLFRMKRVGERYERAGDFRALVGEMDPMGKFRNRFLDGVV